MVKQMLRLLIILLPIAAQSQQYMRPASDVTVNSWTTTPLWSKVNSTNTDGASSFIRNANGNTTAVELSLTSPASTPQGGTCTISVDATASGSSAAEKITVAIYEGASLIATPISGTNVTRSTYNLYTGTFNSNLISNWSNVRVRINMSTGGATEFISVSWVRLEVPDPAPARKVRKFISSQK